MTTRYDFLARNAQKMHLRPRFALGPTGGAYSVPPDLQWRAGCKATQRGGVEPSLYSLATGLPSFRDICHCFYGSCCEVIS